MYDHRNVFAQIIKGEKPCKKIYENEYALAFKDIFPQAEIHVLVIPKGFYTNLTDFLTNSSYKEQEGFFEALKETLDVLKLKDGYRIVSNNGEKGGQVVPHLHFHILAGKNLGPMICNKEIN